MNNANESDQGDDALLRAKALLGVLEETLSAFSQAASEISSEREEVARLLAAAKSQLDDARSHLSTLQSMRSSAEGAQAIIEQKSKHIEDARVHADSVRAELDVRSTEAKSIVAEAEQLRKRVQSIADQAAQVLQDLGSAKQQAEGDSQASRLAKEEAATHAAALGELASFASETVVRLRGLVAAAEELKSQSEAQTIKIEGLLPGATSAGLASSFAIRRDSFRWPIWIWQGIFIFALAVLCWFAWDGLSDMSFSDGWGALALHWLSRLPIVLSLVWLALHASREAALARRLEEEYAFKVAVASSFVGFVKKMEEVGQQATAGSPLEKLCSDTLRNLSDPPGRIYAQHDLTITPVSQWADQASDSPKPSNERE